MALGFFPEGTLGHYWYNTGLEPYSPMIALIALLSGYFIVSAGFSQQAATSTWIVGAVWLAFGIYDTGRGWDASWSPEKTRLAYVLANLFGSTVKCSGSECLGELIFTTPFTACVMYSIGAYIKTRRLVTT